MGRFLALFILSFHFSSILGQPFIEDIRAFKKEDSLSLAGKCDILLIGSSSFTNWRDVGEYFPSYHIINRAFGGSTLLDQKRYVDDVVFPYTPKHILIYCGENDIANDIAVNGDTVFFRFQDLYHTVRRRMPTVKISYVSMKPSPSRFHLFHHYTIGNDKIKEFLTLQKNASFIDVGPSMLTIDGQPNKNIFLEDMLHMNSEGYKLWKQVILPYLSP
jgi:lysophospholipase L1-like esterase